MAKLLFRLGGVPEDEADEVRALLEEHDFECYETQEGRWKIGVAAIWIIDDSEFDAARRLIEALQKERYESLAEQRQIVQDRGFLGNLWHSFWYRPLQFLVYLIAIGIVLAITVWPFIKLSQH